MEAWAALLHTDGRVVVIDKPPGLSLATRHGGGQEAVERVLAALPPQDVQAHGLVATDLRLVHRLDVGTSGLVVLARGSEAHRELLAAFVDRTVDKRYLAVVWGHPRPRQGTLDAPIGPDRRDRRKMAVAADGRAATSHYAVLARAPHAAVLELHPVSGRTHQLRVHLAHAGHPIVGDDFYGGPRHRGVRDHRLASLLCPGRPLLHAWRLTLPATRRSPELRLEAPVPPDLAAVLAGLDPDATALLGGVPWPGVAHGPGIGGTIANNGRSSP